MSSEHQFWQWLRPRLAPFGKFERIESYTKLGIPDINYVFSVGQMRGISGWLELKHVHTFPSREDTPIAIESLTLEQVRWHEAWAKAGGRSSALLKIEQYLFPMDALHLRAVYQREITTRYVMTHGVYINTEDQVLLAILARFLCRNVT